MGMYVIPEKDFIERSLNIYEQYLEKMGDFAEDKRFNHTLLVHCFLGILVVSKQHLLNEIPDFQLTTPQSKKQTGLKLSYLHHHCQRLRSLIAAMRNSIAHFDFKFEATYGEPNKIAIITFQDTQNDKIVAKFHCDEFEHFFRFYGKLAKEAAESYAKKKQNA